MKMYVQPQLQSVAVHVSAASPENSATEETMVAENPTEQQLSCSFICNTS
jgi:hypothetical protein